MAYNVGDRVQLISGGPIMTVEGINELGNVDCTWFFQNKLEHGCFKPGTLKPIGDGQPRSAIRPLRMA
jgi:uncharacterized protein YodC (DUF2158 family)